MNVAKTIAVADGNRDAHYDSLIGWAADGGSIAVGAAGLQAYEGYVQFDVELPVGCKICAATLTLTPSDDSSTPASCDVVPIARYDSDLSDDAHAVADLGAAETWTFGGSWSTDTPVTFDVTTLLQRLVDRSGAAYGDLFTLKLHNAGEGARLFHAYEGAPEKAATLAIEYYTARLLGVARALETLIANCATFQRMTGTATAEAARAFIHHGGLPSVWSAPCALIHELDAVSMRQIALGVSQPSGSAQVTFMAEVDADEVGVDGERDDFEAALAPCADWMGTVADEMSVLAGTAGYLIVSSIDPADGGVWLQDRDRAALSQAEERAIDAGQSFSLELGLSEAGG